MQRPVSTVASFSTSAISSLARRVLPMPGSPTTATTCDGSSRFGLLEDGQQPPKLVLAADELRLQIAGHGGRSGDELEQPEGRHRRLLARLDGLHTDCVADELERRRAEHDRPGRRRLLDSLGDVDRIARDEAAVARVADVDVTRC